MYLEKYLQYLKYEHPPTELSDISDHWTRDLIERCLALALTILPQNANVLKEISSIYVNAKSEHVQQTIMLTLGNDYSR